MKTISVGKYSLVAAITLVGAALACSAPSAQGEVTPSAPAMGEPTNTPFVITAPPEAVVVTLTPGPTSDTAETVAPDSSAGSVTPTSGSTATDCSLDSVYIADLTIPDGTEITAGTEFTKTWRIQNNGCDAWPDGTVLVFVSGKKMSGPASVPVPQTAVNGMREITIDLIAPAAEGDAVGYWQLRTLDGIQFGDKISVKIKVVGSPAPA